jgi:PPM family protein phosphatase
MTLALRYAVRSDVGLLREGNEDSAYAGPHLLAVADGMGGHAAGEVASAATITTIAGLDADYPAADLVNALADAVASANLRLQEIIISDPSVEGMGTTLTALLWSDGRAALCHIGDSRAYLLRNGQFYQITHDHTLVQSLVDEGKITEDDVATHPHRSLLLRALDGRTVADPDLSTHETMAGDRYLLCSDGLSGVVTEQTLHQTLSSVWDPDKAALQLVELAIKGGGPDNITCIVADVVDTQTTALAPTRVPVLAGAASHGSATELRSTARQNSPATRAMRLTRTAPQAALPDEAELGDWGNGYNGHGPDGNGPDGNGPDGNGANGNGANGGTRGGRHSHRARRHQYDDEDDDDDYARHHNGKRRWPVVSTLLVVLVLVIGGGLYVGWRYVQGQYYVGVQDGNVAIFRGVNQSVAGISLSSLAQRTNLPVSEMSTADQETLAQTSPSASSLAGAQSLVNHIQSGVNQCRREWVQLKDWEAANIAYQRAMTAYRAKKPTKGRPAGKPPVGPGQQPGTPAQAACAPSLAFGIPTSALPPSGGQPTTTPTSTRTAVTPTPRASAKASHTASRAAG